jgi:hypothetical protein
LELGLASQPFTSAVTSTRRNAFAVLAGMDAKGALAAGAEVKVTPPSVQLDVTAENVSVPAVVTLLTYTRKYATLTLVTPGDSVLRSNCTSATLPGAMLRLVAPP